MNPLFSHQQRSFLTRILLALGAVVTAYLIGQCNAAYASPPKPFYGAPYYDNDAYFYVPPEPTVAQAVQADWDEYQQYWGVEPYGDLVCSYTFTPSSDGPQTGYFGLLLWTGDCGGGDGIYGTLQCPPGYKLVGLICVGSTGVTIDAHPPFIPLGSEVNEQTGHVLTLSKLDLTVTQDGDPLSGISVPLQSDRGAEDQIEGGGPTDSFGASFATVTTWDQPGISTITSASPDIETIAPGIIQWLPAPYAGLFEITCYGVAQESLDTTGPMVPMVGLPGKHHQSFVHNTGVQGTGELLNGQYVQWSKYFNKYVYSPCPKTASGICATTTTAAVDPTLIPTGSGIQISAVGDRTAGDTGGSIGGYHIDIFYGSSAADYMACKVFGVKSNQTVILLGYGD